MTALEAQGLGRKVVADMFGIALRSYQRKVQRLAGSVTERDRTLWSATLDFVREAGPVSRARVMTRFARDDEQSVRAVLHDLAESGLVYVAGRGQSARYRAAEPDELDEALTVDEAATRAAFVWVHVYQHGPVDRAGLQRVVRLPEAQLQQALDELVAEGRVEALPGEPVRWQCRTFVLPVGTSVGWEAALLHHYQAMVTSMVAKLQAGDTRSLPSDVMGGSTYEFPMWAGHPYEAQVYDLLRETRRRASALRSAITAHNDAVGRRANPDKVTFYVGQGVVFGDGPSEERTTCED